MFRHRSSALVIGVLVAACLAATTAPAGSARATDACADPVNEPDVAVVPWQDLCELEMSAVAADGEPTQIEVRLGMASVDRVTATALQVGFTDAAGCAVLLFFGDAAGEHDAASTIGRTCGGADEAFDDCAADVDLGVVRVGPCRRGHDATPVAAPVVEGSTYVWRIAVEGEVAQLIGELPVGSMLEELRATAGSRTWRQSPSGERLLCAGNEPRQTCYNVNDRMTAADTVEVVTG